MENSFQTSFIPKKPISPAPTAAPLPQPKSFGFFGTIALGFLILIGVIAGGLFAYKNFLTNQKGNLSQSLSRARDSFEKDTITELETFDKRVSASKKILASHIVLSPLFSLIGELTIPSIQFTKFEHQFTDKGLFYVKMTGVARDYKSIATQSDILGGPKGRYLKSVVFSNLTTTEIKEKDTKKTTVGFNVEFIVDPTLLSYEKNILITPPLSSLPAQAGQAIIPTEIPTNSFPESIAPANPSVQTSSSGATEVLLSDTESKTATTTPPLAPKKK